MKEHDSQTTETRLAGYSKMIARFGLDVIPNWHESTVASGNSRSTTTANGRTEEVFPASYWPGDTLGDHFEFALKYDGTNLGILSAVFQSAPAAEVLAYVESKPRGKYARRIWYLHELLTGRRLPISDLGTGGYIRLLEPEETYTLHTPRRIRRQRIDDNLLGDARFCATIRRTETLRRFEEMDMAKRCREVVARYSPQMLRRAMSYLYTKETKSSFEIEHIKPTSSRTERFVSLLRSAEKEDFCKKELLVELQNRIVDPRFHDDDYRTNQNYIGETISPRHERVHYICPRAEDVGKLMAGLVSSHKAMESGGVPVVIHAAAVAYGFVFIHPFGDGNGRIHRFLIHNILARRGFSPAGVVLPVSAAMLKDPNAYDTSLEAFSRPLMSLAEYTLDSQGRINASNNPFRLYAFMDMTAQAEALFQFLEKTVGTELVEELNFLESYDRTKSAIQGIVDLPDQKIDLFMRFCLQNKGRLSTRKRASHFDMLTDEEIASMEDALQVAYRTKENHSHPRG